MRVIGTMLRELVLIGAVLFAAGHAKVCPSLDIRNNPESLEKLRNCTIIMGHLMVVLMHKTQNSSAFDRYVFPELTEIDNYLIFFSVKYLTSIGKMFPNLRVIRGNVLFGDTALVIWNMYHLEEIGLTNLQVIGRGAVRIDLCPKLCFAETINWKSLGAYTLHYTNTTGANTCQNRFCPGECGKYCWNTTHCQKFVIPGKCHPMCIGCTKEGSPESCSTCRYYEDHGRCVITCPPTKYANEFSMKCLTREECTSMLNGSWWVFEQTCVNSCPFNYEQIDEPVKMCRKIKNYKKYCNGTVIDSLSILEEMTHCTHINGSLDIRLSDSHIITHKDLIKNLGQIKSISGYLKIGRSNAVRSLDFFKSLQVIEGKSLENKRALFVFENPNLQRLWNFSDHFSLNITHGSVAFYNNPQLCYSEIEKLLNIMHINNRSEADEISRSSNGQKSLCNPKNLKVEVKVQEATSVTIEWHEGDDDVIGYMVYYTPASKDSVITFDDDACNVDAWNNVFVRNNTVVLKPLTPFTRYAYYIQTYKTSSKDDQTPVYYFNTSSDDPTGPLDLRADAINDTTITLLWDRPTQMNGILSHYSVTMSLQEDYLPMIEDRDYCQYPHTEPEEEIEPQPKVSTTFTFSDCPCLAREEYFFMHHDQTCGHGRGDCNKYMYYPSTEDFTDDLIIEKSIQKRTPMEENPTSNDSQTFQTRDENYTVTNLKHFSVYLFYVQACNLRGDNGTQCGGVEMASNRTKKREDADNVDKVHVTVDDEGAFVQWSEPVEVNSVVVSYQIEHKRIDLEHAKPIPECITRRQHMKQGEKYPLRGLSPGTYKVRVRATSLAGPGEFSPWMKFEISPPNSGLRWVYVLIGVVLVLIAVLGLYIFRYWYRKKYALDNNHLITSINPDYAGPIYEEDEWEIDRNDIEIIKELGQGSFGMVYEGLIKSRRYPCAVKTVNDSASMISRMEFLNEGSVMKAFNDAHHVIKLLGIVSRGQPPLVIMELMERGDLKSYLRRCREPSQNLTTNEMYRMAAEIADGMAYLAAKKFVHRDLAARNCMVAADRTVKIGDFGMARDVYETDYYRKETVGLLPVRWMAPESLADGVFTTDSDVWSYGIVLWEMATLAEQPYQGLANEQVFHFVKNKGRLDRPPECSDLLYEVMDACWMWRPNDRPTFADIVDKLVDHVGQDFRLVSFCFSRQGRDLALNAGPRVYNPPAVVALPEEDLFSHFDASEEEVSLYLR